MKNLAWVSVHLLLLSLLSHAASKPHVIAFGKPQIVRSYAGAEEDKAFELKVRPLYVDSRLKEYTVGPAHDITDRLFAVGRAFRLNDSLPEEPSVPRWRWQRGGWVLVDRVTGRVSPINLPDFDSSYSAAVWYRDYIGYCGLADDGKKVFAIVVQIGRRKPVLKRLLGEITADDPAAALSRAPVWQRQPTRVSFTPPQGNPLTFSIRGHIVGLVSNDEEEDASE
jgi:hypothetical protein